MKGGVHPVTQGRLNSSRTVFHFCGAPPAGTLLGLRSGSAPPDFSLHIPSKWCYTQGGLVLEPQVSDLGCYICYVPPAPVSSETDEQLCGIWIRPAEEGGTRPNPKTCRLGLWCCWEPETTVRGPVSVWLTQTVRYYSSWNTALWGGIHGSLFQQDYGWRGEVVLNGTRPDRALSADGLLRSPTSCLRSEETGESGFHGLTSWWSDGRARVVLCEAARRHSGLSGERVRTRRTRKPAVCLRLSVRLSALQQRRRRRHCLTAAVR